MFGYRPWVTRITLPEMNWRAVQPKTPVQEPEPVLLLSRKDPWIESRTDAYFHVAVTAVCETVCHLGRSLHNKPKNTPQRNECEDPALRNSTDCVRAHNAGSFFSVKRKGPRYYLKLRLSNQYVLSPQDEISDRRFDIILSRGKLISPFIWLIWDFGAVTSLWLELIPVCIFHWHFWWSDPKNDWVCDIRTSRLINIFWIGKNFCSRRELFFQMVCSSTSNSFGLSRYLGHPELVQKKNANENLAPLLLNGVLSTIRTALKLQIQMCYRYILQKFDKMRNFTQKSLPGLGNVTYDCPHADSVFGDYSTVLSLLNVFDKIMQGDPVFALFRNIVSVLDPLPNDY